jgi:hypothetical protein
LSPGEHRIALLRNGTNDSEEIGTTEIYLGDENVNGVVLTPFTPATVRVRVMQEGSGRPLTAGSVSLGPNEEDGSVAPGLSQLKPQNGIYIFHGVRSGKYQITFAGNQVGSYLKSVDAGGRFLDPSAIEVAENSSLDLVMTYSDKIASVTGDVDVGQEGFKGSFRILLIDENAVEWAKVFSTEPDQSFHFSVSNLRPSKYLAFAAQEGDFDLWTDSQFLAAMEEKATKLELHESEHAMVHLKLIPKAVTDTIRQQLGL